MTRRCMAPAVALLATLMTGACAVKDAKMKGPRIPDKGYENLPERAKWLLGTAGTEEQYRSLPEAERATYEAVVHALDHYSLLESVDAVTQIWGEAEWSLTPRPSGTNQFRLSVIFSRDATRRFWEKGFRFTGGGHVKLSNGRLRGNRHTWSARGPGNPPTLQMSWVRADPRIGEIDIDYRPLQSGMPHVQAANSDVRDQYNGVGHVCSYQEKYGDDTAERLGHWADKRRSRCDERRREETDWPATGWMFVGTRGVPETWVLSKIVPVSRETTLEEAIEEEVILRTDKPLLMERWQPQAQGLQVASPGVEVSAGECVRATATQRQGSQVWAQVKRIPCHAAGQ